MPTILIIEEDDLMRGLLVEWLTAAGYAARGRAVLEPGEAAGADLVIVDLYMPRQAGVDVVREVQKALPGTPLIAMSAQFRPGLNCSARAARALGVGKLVCKPFTRDDLLGAVGALIGPR